MHLKQILTFFFFAFLIAFRPILAQTYEPKIFVQYHLWFTTEDKRPDWQGTTWAGWSQTTKGAEVIDGVDPTYFITPWRRVTASRLGLPITGLYSSQNDPEVIKYYFRQAKEAGIDGMFASVYDGAWVPIFRSHLRAAGETGMKIAQELYHGTTIDKPGNPGTFNMYPTQANGCKIYRTWLITQMTDAIKPYLSNSGFLRIDGKPAVRISNGPICSNLDPTNFGSCTQKWSEWFPQTDCQVPEMVYSWGNVQEMKELLTQVEQNVGEAIYVVLQGNPLDNLGQAYASVPQIGKILPFTANNFGLFWNLFGEHNQVSVKLGESDRLRYESEYQTRITADKNSAGNKFAVQINPSFDERGLFPTSSNRGSGYNKPRAIVTRDGNGMYEKNDGFLKAALDIAKRNELWVFIDSWNDWMEQHQLEPGFAFNNFLYHQDYFSPLRRMAEFKGIASPNFSFPDPSLLDPPLVKYCRYKQFEGQKVKLKGKFGFSKTASQTNGVNFTVSYFSDYLSDKDPSWQGSTTRETLASVTKTYTGQLKSFEIDITPVLDMPGLVFGIESNGNNSFDQVYFTEFKLDWYGQEVDLLNGGTLSQLNWSSQKGSLIWPTNGVNGTATMSSNNLLEDGQTYIKTLYLHPNFDVPGDTFVRAGVDWMKFEPFIPQCSLNPCSEKSKGDADCSESINLMDFNQWVGVYTKIITNQQVTEAEKQAVDFNGSGSTDLIDFMIWLENYQKTF